MMENKTLYAVQLREEIVSHIYVGEASQDVERAFPFLKSRELIALGKYERTKSYLMYAANVGMLWAKAKYLYINKGYETCLDDEIIARLNLPPVGDINGDYISKVFVLTTDLDKARRYVNSNSTQINDEPPRIQPTVKEKMDIIWDDDGKCALLISPMEDRLENRAPDCDKNGILLDVHLGSIKDELEYYKGALEAVERKLSNPKFRELASDKAVALNEKRRQRIKEKIAELEGQ